MEQATLWHEINVVCCYQPHMTSSNWNSSVFPSSRSARLPVCLSFDYNFQCPLFLPHLLPQHHRMFQRLRLLPYLNRPYIQASDISNSKRSWCVLGLFGFVLCHLQTTRVRVIAPRTDSKNSLRLMRPPRMTQTNFSSHSKALYARLRSVESKHWLFRVFLSGYGKQQALQLGRMYEGLKDPWKSSLSHKINVRNPERKRSTLCFFDSDQVARKLDCKTVRIFAHSSTRKQSNKRSGTFSIRALLRPLAEWPMFVWFSVGVTFFWRHLCAALL